MENRRILKHIFLGTLAGIAITVPFFSMSYNEITTHPALTQEMVKFFNKSFPNKQINQKDEELVIKGSIDEDAFGRWLRHFYDPVNKRGLTFLGKEWESSLAWSKDTLAQATYKIEDLPDRTLYGKIKDLFTGETDYSWDRAIYEYTWGDKERGMEALGHVLHLLEDASVPDHTRNDPHPGAAMVLQDKLPNFVPEWLLSRLDHSQSFNSSPYESFAVRFDRSSIKVASSLDNEKPTTLPNLEDYFNKIAVYSNSNFFSGDSILIKEFERPHIIFEKQEKLNNNKTYLFGYTKNSSGEHKLVRIDRKFQKDDVLYSIEDPDNLILTDYWNNLSKQAVLNGAGVIKLFFDEVEKEKQTKELYYKNRSWLSKKIDNFKNGVFNVATVLYGVTPKQTDLVGDEPIPTPPVKAPPAPKITKPETKNSEIASKSVTTPPVPVQTISIEKTKQTELPAKTTEPPAPQAQHKSSNTSSIVPIAGVGNSPPAPAPSGDTTAPDAPIISSPTENYISSSTSVNFSGTAESNSTISQSFSGLTSSVTNLGAWVLNLSSLLQGTTTINFYASDSSNNTSSGATRTIFVDSTAPSTSITVSECSQSLATNACMVATSTVNVSWSSSDADLSYYIVECEKSSASCVGFPNLSNTTATSTSYVLPTDNSSYIFKVKAVDTRGNQSAQQTQTVEYASRPVVINEIAWSGTSGTRTSDEWIELYNPSDVTLDLSAITLVSETDSGPNITLSGSLSSRGYYLIERTDDNTISDITASTTSSFVNGLNNAGEVLALKKGSIILDRTPQVATCGGWCGGVSGGSYQTMERYDFEASGEDSSNWSNFSSILANGHNADNVAIYGTPGRRNSLNYLLDINGSALNQSKTIKKSNSPYIINSSEFTVASGVTMTVEPGVVIKFNPVSSLKIDGILNAQGTASKKIVFTSLRDDDYGGDTNADGSGTSPAAGNWKSIKILSQGSVMDNTILRYGGNKDVANDFWADLRVEGVSMSVSNSTVEKSGAYGIYYKNAFGNITSNTVTNNTTNGNADSSGVVIEGGSPTVSSNTISNNIFGLLILNNSTSTISNNTFTSNSGYAAQSIGAYPSFSGSTATSNGTNGINLQGTVAQNYTLGTDLPYVIQNTTYTINSGNTLTIPAGTVIKLQGAAAYISASGKIIANGTSSNKVVFTSLYDDTYGGDTNADGSGTSPAAGNWQNITFESTAASSSLAYAVFRYGGDTSSLNSNDGALRIKDTSIDIANSTIEYNYLYGIWTQNSTSTTISNSLIQYHQDSTPEAFYGLYLTSNSTPTIINTTFNTNENHIFYDGTSTSTNIGVIFQP